MDWLAANLVWIVPAVWSAVETFRKVRGTRRAKAWEAAKALHGAAKVAHRARVEVELKATLQAVGDKGREIELMVPKWDRQLDELEVVNLGRHPNATAAEKAEGRRVALLINSR